MIISKTPYRISFFGGGTDYPDWYLKYGGQVISTSIDKYIYISCRHLPPFFKHSIRLAYSKIEYCNNVNQIKHPSARSVLSFLGTRKNLEIHYDGDLPSKSGIGSSSSFTVGLINAVSKNININFTKKQLAKISLHIEQNITKETVGSQDQISASYGGLNHIKFNNDGTFKVNPLKITLSNKNLLQKRLMLFHTGIFRIADTITKNYVNKFNNKIKYLEELDLLTSHSINLLKKGQIDDFGKLLNETWNVKKNISQSISNNKINQIYETAILNGALGGKLLGAGAGGFILFYVKEENQNKLKNSLSKLLHIPFKFESNGSKIIFNNTNKYYVEQNSISIKQKKILKHKLKKIL